MKDLSVRRLAMVFAGCFLGAGYVSGQELWQYFGRFGAWGYAGVFLAISLLAGCGILIIRLVQLTGITEADKLMIPWDNKILQGISAFLALALMFAVCVIMTAGVGALAEQLLGVSHILGSILFALLVLAIALLGINGLVNAFSATVPILVVCTVIFGIITLARCGLPDFSASSGPTEGSTYLGNWLIAAFNFVSYNTFGTIPILAPLGPMIQKRGTAFRGVLLGAGLLLLIALSVLTSVLACKGASDAELPMLYTASLIAPWAGWIYAVLLFFGMFGTGLSSFVGTVNICEQKFAFVHNHRGICSVFLTVLAFAASLAGFGDLIGTLYPFFGYCCVLFILLMLGRLIAIIFNSLVRSKNI